jgi:hypothetical protein
MTAFPQRMHAPRPTTLAAVCLLTVAQAACDSAGPSDHPHLDGFPQLSATAEARIGSVEDPDIGFSRIAGVDVDGEGNVYVLEGSVPEIRVYSPTGRLLRRIGRAGGGPGEFQGYPRFGVVGDTLWTFDNTNRRITLFRRDGTVLSTAPAAGVRVAVPQMYGTLLPLRMRPDGKFISHFGSIGGVRDEPAPDVQPDDSIPVPFVLFDATGAVTDTVGWAPSPPPRMWRPPGQYDTEYTYVTVAGRRMTAPRPPTTMPWWETVEDGYISVETPVAASPEEGIIMVTRFGLAGDTLYDRRLRYVPEPYTDAALDAIADRAGRGEPGGMVPFSPGASAPDNWRAIAAAMREAMDFPAYQLPIQSPWFGQDGSAWLRRWDGTTPEAEWFILDAAGKVKGRLTLDAGISPRWTDGEVFWAVESDELDIPWLARYRITQE